MTMEEEEGEEEERENDTSKTQTNIVRDIGSHLFVNNLNDEQESSPSQPSASLISRATENSPLRPSPPKKGGPSTPVLRKQSSAADSPEARVLRTLNSQDYRKSPEKEVSSGRKFVSQTSSFSTSLLDTSKRKLRFQQQHHDSMDSQNSLGSFGSDEHVAETRKGIEYTEDDVQPFHVKEDVESYCAAAMNLATREYIEERLEGQRARQDLYLRNLIQIGAVDVT